MSACKGPCSSQTPLTIAQCSDWHLHARVEISLCILTTRGRHRLDLLSGRPGLPRRNDEPLGIRSHRVYDHPLGVRRAPILCAGKQRRYVGAPRRDTGECFWPRPSPNRWAAHRQLPALAPSGPTTSSAAAPLTPATGLGGRHRLGRAAAKLLRRARDRHVLPFRTPALERGESGWAGLVASGSGQPQWTWQHRLVARVAYDFFAAGWTSLLLRRLKQVRRGWTELQVTQRARGERLGLGLVLGWGRGHGLSARSLAAWVGTGAPFLHAARAREHPRMCQSLPQTLTLTRPDGAAHGPAYAPRLHHGLYRIADPPRRVCRGHHVPVKPQWFARSD